MKVEQSLWDVAKCLALNSFISTKERFRINCAGFYT